VKLIPASEVPSDQLSEFFGRVLGGEQAFLKEDVGESISVATVYGTTLRSAPCSAHPRIGLLRSLPMTPSKSCRPRGRTGAPAHCPGSVLEQHHHDVIKRMGPIRHQPSLLTHRP
jgi:hypothetical protein